MNSGRIIAGVLISCTFLTNYILNHALADDQLSASASGELLLSESLASTSKRKLQSVSINDCIVRVEYTLDRVCSAGSDWQPVAYTDHIDLSDISLDDRDIWKFPSKNGEETNIIWRYDRSVRDVLRQLNTMFQGRVSQTGVGEGEDVLGLSDQVSSALTSANIESNRTSRLCNSHLLVEPPLSEGVRFVVVNRADEVVQFLRQYVSDFCIVSD